MSSFETLNALNVNEHTEKKGNLTYLSWAWAWAEVKKIYPTATYEIKKFDNDMPYLYDEKTGYMVFTTVTIDELTYEMWLPVMDYKNKAMMSPSMFDINKTIMRCLVKNLAMFGLGLYIYSGEDLPESGDVNDKISEDKIKQIHGILNIYPKENRQTTIDILCSKFGVKDISELTKEQFVKFRNELLDSTEKVKKQRLDSMVETFAKRADKTTEEAKQVIELCIGKNIADISIAEFHKYAKQVSQMIKDLDTDEQ